MEAATDRGRVVQVFEPPIGGVPAYVVALTAGLAERGWEVDVVHPENGRIRMEVEAAGGRSVALPFTHAPAPGDVTAIASLAQMLRADPPSLVHAHSTKAGLIGGMAARLAGVPCVYTPHGWAFQRRDIGRSERVLYAAFERGFARWCHRSVVTVAAEEKDVAMARGIAPSGGIDAVHTGLRPAPAVTREDARCRLGLDEDEVVAAWVGRRAPQKRPQDLVWIARRLGRSVRIVALGQGLGESAEGVALIRAGGTVADEGTDPGVIYAAADLFVQTSAWEGLSLAVLEAMDAGLPVVAYAVGGLSEQVDEGRTGFLVAPGAADAASRLIARLARDASLREQMGAAARRRAGERFSFDRMLDGIEDVYDRTLACA